MLDPLPIDAILPELVANLRESVALVLRAPTGAGKTTRVPPALLDAKLTEGRVLVLEPRRLAARAAARRMAEERRQRLGDDVGYHVRFDRQVGPRTRIIVMTPGILLRMLQDDPFLETVGIIVFDEFHERALDNDLALGMIRLLQTMVRTDLRIVVMSATLATDAISAYLAQSRTMRGHLRAPLLALIVLGGAAASSPPRQASRAINPPAKNASAPARLDLAYSKPVTVGAAVRATVAGLPPGKPVDLTWGTVKGGWVIEGYYNFRGKKYEEVTTTLGRFMTSADGRLDVRFTIPEDYGGVHEIFAVIDGRTVAQNGLEVTQSFELTPTSGPPGTPIELKVKGLGWRTMESTWVVNWDNNALGWVSAAGTMGSAVARFRAAGPTGDHVIKVYTGWQGQAYLNYEQSPVAHLPRPDLMFHTSAGRATTPTVFAEPYQPQPVPKTEVHVPNAAVTLGPTQGPVGTRTVLRAQGLPRGATLKVVWQTSVGSRVTDAGFAPRENVLTEVRVAADGRLDAPITVPDDLGGLHGLALRQGDTLIAQAYFVIETSIVGMTPTSGPVGTPVTIHLKGVGWTEYDNIYVATYDNGYMGYACGFNSQGDVVINFKASGAPGPHVIDLYPGIYQGPPTEPQLLYRLPQLTYADDHPGNKIPALRFMFEIAPSSASSE